jgi:hypothetical protein
VNFKLTDLSVHHHLQQLKQGKAGKLLINPKHPSVSINAVVFPGPCDTRSVLRGLGLLHV